MNAGNGARLNSAIGFLRVDEKGPGAEGQQRARARCLAGTMEKKPPRVLVMVELERAAAGLPWPVVR
jgi:hypothetical protein